MANRLPGEPFEPSEKTDHQARLEHENRASFQSMLRRLDDMAKTRQRRMDFLKGGICGAVLTAAAIAVAIAFVLRF
jgi:hypothetical protein